ncbi:hypothetical protein [Streptomyces sp. JNUCC 63]
MTATSTVLNVVADTIAQAFTTTPKPSPTTATFGPTITSSTPAKSR